MLVKHHNSKGSFVRRRNPAQSRANVLIALVLALSLGSAGQTPPAQAAPARVPAKVYMDIVSPKTTLCVGQETVYEARVYTPPTVSAGISFGAFAISGIRVEAFSQDPGVGDFTGAKKKELLIRTTGGNDDELVDLITREPVESVPNAARFGFKAKKAGKTTLYFEASAHEQYVSAPVTVRVINCKYKITVNTQHRLSGPANAKVVTSFSAMVEADENGAFKVVQPQVKWSPTISAVRDCKGKLQVSSTTATVSGFINNNSEPVLSIEYTPGTVTEEIKCKSITGMEGFQLTPPSLTKMVMRPEGGTRKISNTMGGFEMPGFSTLSVTVIKPP